MTWTCVLNGAGEVAAQPVGAPRAALACSLHARQPTSPAPVQTHLALGEGRGGGDAAQQQQRHTPCPLRVKAALWCLLRVRLQSTAALPFGTIVIIIVIWALITFPLTVLGGIAAKNSKAELSAPCR